MTGPASVCLGCCDPLIIIVDKLSALTVEDIHIIVDHSPVFFVGHIRVPEKTLNNVHCKDIDAFALAVIPRARVCTADPEAVHAVLAEEFEIVAQSFDRGECQRFKVPIKRIIPYGHALGNPAPLLEFLGVGVIRRAVGIRSVLGALFSV